VAYLKTSNLIVRPVAPLSRLDIEAKTLKIARDLHPHVLTKPGPFPIREFFEFDLPEVFGLETGVESGLPYGIEGTTDPADGTVLVAEQVFEAMADGDGRGRFTVGHESGHGVLHVDQLHRKLVDGRLPGYQRTSQMKPFLSPEWQADYFSAALLMAAPAMARVVSRYGGDVSAVADIFLVSRTAARRRLNTLSALKMLGECAN
jgi:hypothetical protein